MLAKKNGTQFGNPKSVVVMPALNRPELAALALQRISQTPEASQLDVRIFVDHTVDHRLGEFEYVRDEYFPDATIYHAREHIQVPSGSWNILQALKAGYDSGASLIFLIEEDVMVFSDYFTWSFEAHDDPDCFATCGRLRKEYRMDYYTNPGASFKSESLKSIVPHITDRYFEDQRSYLDATFGQMDEASPLDDGLIRRVIRQLDAKISYPQTPKVAHQGFHYYNKLVQFKVEGSISERISAARLLMSKVSPADRYSKDFEPFPLQQRNECSEALGT
jgi:hypothetical protein